MFSDLEFRKKLNSDDIIVWNGTTTRWHFVQHLVLDGDMIRMADDAEVDHYRNVHERDQEKVYRENKSRMEIEIFVKYNGITPTHLRFVPAMESYVITLIPEEWHSDYHKRQFVAEYYTDGKPVGAAFIGEHHFDKNLNEIYPITEFINGK